MSEILKDRLKKSVGKNVLIFLHNGFRYEGRITNCDNEYIEILDYKINSYTTLELIDIKQVQVKNNGVGK